MKNKIGRMLTIQNPYPILFYFGKTREIRGTNIKKDLGSVIYLYVGTNDLNSEREKIILEKFDISTKDYLNGVIFGRAFLKSTRKLTEDHLKELKLENSSEFEMGWYDIGRYELELNNIELLENPIPIKEGGALFVKNFDVSQVEDADFIPQSVFVSKKF